MRYLALASVLVTALLTGATVAAAADVSRIGGESFSKAIERSLSSIETALAKK